MQIATFYGLLEAGGNSGGAKFLVIGLPRTINGGSERKGKLFTYTLPISLVAIGGGLEGRGVGFRAPRTVFE